MDKVDAQDMLPMLFWSKLFDTKPGVHVGGWSQFGGSETQPKHCPKNKGLLLELTTMKTLD